ncbi:hypothetical protein UFOVP1419_12 [uncultured Caudovirales phage]|uniref:DHHA1 domain-containing protein n=1 Tax=uncultured Caudovirales phage TaxID=2100421 RepID=A0A6J5SD21_9CAUD|nr:hypothetical protein UFOVP1419_12 [uncultured Caudovirales phage]
MKCFYHSADKDGHCSGAIVKMVYPDCEMIGINYGQPFPWETIAVDDVVFMVDFSLQPFADMILLKEACAQLVWIDHHKSAIEERDLAGVPIGGMQLVGKAGCELTWDYLIDRIDISTPRAVFMLGRYDVWDWMNHPGAMEFQKGMWQFDTDPNNTEFWERLFTDDELVEEITHNGGLLLAAQKKDNESYLRATGFETMLNGFRVLAVNKGLTNSTLFDSGYDPEKHDAMVSFCWYRDKWKISVYADDKTHPEVDASLICKIYGGGGHKGASGFQCDVLPFNLVPA